MLMILQETRITMSIRTYNVFKSNYSQRKIKSKNSHIKVKLNYTFNGPTTKNIKQKFLSYISGLFNPLNLFRVDLFVSRFWFFDI